MRVTIFLPVEVYDAMPVGERRALSTLIMFSGKAVNVSIKSCPNDIRFDLYGPRRKITPLISALIQPIIQYYKRRL